jgi:hypothetical protein
MERLLFRSLTLLAAMLVAVPAWGQVSTADRADIVRLAQARGAGEADVQPLLQEVDRAVQRSLPSAPLVNKVKEGLAKGFPPARVLTVLRDFVANMDTARDMLGNVPDESARLRATIVLTEALSRGMTRAEFDELRRLTEQNGAAQGGDRLALGARTWAALKEAGFPGSTALPLVAEAVRQGFRDADLLALAREATTRRQELSASDLTALREAVRRGERPERLFPPREAPETPERTRTERPAATPTRPEAQRPERPAR